MGVTRSRNERVEIMPAGEAHATRKLKVWDLPTRMFHWSLLALILVSWFSGGEDESAGIHRLSGMLLCGLIVFRTVWGFAGGEHSRFAAFFPNPARIISHLRKVATGTPERHLGHNPVGGVAVFLLLGAVSVCIFTGLMSSGEGLTGPLAGYAPFEMSNVHELAFRALQALVVLHLIGVALESWLAKDGLVPAMITGRKIRGAGEPGEHARLGSVAGLVLAVALGAGATVFLLSLPEPSRNWADEGACEWRGEKLRCDD
ncbi:MAG TPA: cytochrome b/b6 domain-containing protein [Hyphomonas sp.]|nr:cytochrome b/b6 domain-containing protein [Hyphomonas sp.]